MDKPKDTRPFNLEHAKAGAPIACANGRAVEILKWDFRDRECPVLGLVKCSDVDLPTKWNAGGIMPSGYAHQKEHYLVMLPLGYIDGKPVFVGDEIELKCFAGIDGNEWKRVKTEPGWAGTWNDTGEIARWPAPAKVYPETRMTPDDIGQVYCGFNGTCDASLRAVANAALRHAIDARQVVTGEIFDEVLAERDAFVLERAARDMAVARAVLRKCLAKTDGTWPSAEASGAAITVHKRIRDEVDLAAVIAKVPQ